MEGAQHEALLDIALAIPAPVAISGYESALYGRLADWRRIEYAAMTRGGTIATEVLWCNYPEPAELHDYRYLGANRIERQNIKRKKARWTERLERMPLLEQQALLAAIEAWRASA